MNKGCVASRTLVVLLVALTLHTTDAFLGNPSHQNAQAFSSLLSSTPRESLYLPRCPRWPRPVPFDPAALPQTIEAAIASVNQSIASYLQENNLTGAFHVTATADQANIWEQGFGQVSTSQPGVSPSSTSVFRIGSLTKLFTVALMLHMRDEGIIRSLDDAVNAYQPEFRPSNPFPSTRITFRQLASHLGGLGREGPCLDLFAADFDYCNHNSSVIFSRYQAESLIYPPDTLPSYSNMGFAVIGNVLGSILLEYNNNMLPDSAAVCAKTAPPETCMYEAAVSSLIFDTLKFQCTSYEIPENAGDVLVDGYAGDIKSPLFELGWLAPAGQIYSCNHDLSKLLSFYMRDQKPVDEGDEQPLDGETIREMFMDRFLNNDARTSYGLPWETFHMPVNSVAASGVARTGPDRSVEDRNPSAPRGLWVHTKSGMVPGYTANIGLSRDLKLGVTVLCAYGPPDAPCPHIFWQAMYGLAGPVSDYYNTYAQEPALPQNYKDYLGNYKVKLGHLPVPVPYSIQVKANEQNARELLMYSGAVTGSDSLYGTIVQISGQSDVFAIVPAHSTAFPDVFESDCMGVEDGYNFQQVIFHRNLDGEVKSLSIPSLYYGIRFSKGLL